MFWPLPSGAFCSSTSPSTSRTDAPSQREGTGATHAACGSLGMCSWAWPAALPQQVSTNRKKTGQGKAGQEPWLRAGLGQATSPSCGRPHPRRWGGSRGSTGCSRRSALNSSLKLQAPVTQREQAPRPPALCSDQGGAVDSSGNPARDTLVPMDNRFLSQRECVCAVTNTLKVKIAPQNTGQPCPHQREGSIACQQGATEGAPVAILLQAAEPLATDPG